MAIRHVLKTGTEILRNPLIREAKKAASQSSKAKNTKETALKVYLAYFGATALAGGVFRARTEYNSYLTEKDINKNVRTIYHYDPKQYKDELIPKTKLRERLLAIAAVAFFSQVSIPIILICESPKGPKGIFKGLKEYYWTPYDDEIGKGPRFKDPRF